MADHYSRESKRGRIRLVSDLYQVLPVDVQQTILDMVMGINAAFACGDRETMARRLALLAELEKRAWKVVK